MFLGISANDPTAYPSDRPQMLREQVKRAHFTFPYAVDKASRQRGRSRPTARLSSSSTTGSCGCCTTDSTTAVAPDDNLEVTGEDVLQAVKAAGSGNVVSGDQPASLGCYRSNRQAAQQPGYVLAF